MQPAILAGTANPALAQDIAEALGVPLLDGEFGRFADGEIKLQIRESVRHRHVFLVQPSCSNGDASVNDSLVEMLLALDALKRGSAGAITAVIPYFGYGRQDRKTSPRQPISAALAARLIEAAGAERVVAFDLHAGAIEGFFSVPVTHLSSLPIARKHFTEKMGSSLSECVVVSPDEGGVKRAGKLANRLGCPLAFLHKARPADNASRVIAVIGEVEGKTALVYDDMVDTAGSLCNAAEALKAGGAKAVHAFCTHGLLSGDAEQRVEESALDSLAITDSIPTTTDNGKADARNISVIPVAPLFAEAISRIHEGRSVSELFD